MRKTGHFHFFYKSCISNCRYKKKLFTPTPVGFFFAPECFKNNVMDDKVERDLISILTESPLYFELGHGEALSLMEIDEEGKALSLIEIDKDNPAKISEGE